MTDQIKQVYVVRKDLNMRRGKCIAQCCHAAASIGMALENLKQMNIRYGEYDSYKNNKLVQNILSWVDEWQSTGSTKIVVSVNSEEELMSLYRKFVDIDDLFYVLNLVRDEGRTEFNGVPTNTCFVVGPAPASLIDPLTSNLKLL